MLVILLFKAVLGLAEMELIFPIAALIALCFVVVARKVLITHQFLVSTQHQGCLSNIPPSPVGWGWAGSWEGTQLGQLTQTDQRDIPDRMTSVQQ